MDGGACKREIECMTDIGQFFGRVRMIIDYRILEWYGFYLDNLIGIFREKDIPEIKQFCKENPEYHIVTVTHPGRYANKFIPGNDYYHLADGDSNPNLILNPFLEKSIDLVMDEMFDETLAIARKMYGSRQ